MKNAQESVQVKETKEQVLKETKYCKLLKQATINDKDGLGYTYALEKVFIKEMEREELRICLYKDMKNRNGTIQNKMLARPCDLTEMEFIQLMEKAIKQKLFTDECLTYLRNIINQK